MANSRTLSASHIRYLLAMRACSRADGGVRCIDIASALHLSKSSVHNMMDGFVRSGLVCKNAYGMAYFTDSGREAAERYDRYYRAISRMLERNFPDAPDLWDAACLLLSEIPEPALEALCEREQGVSGTGCLPV